MLSANIKKNSSFKRIYVKVYSKQEVGAERTAKLYSIIDSCDAENTLWMFLTFLPQVVHPHENGDIPIEGIPSVIRERTLVECETFIQKS